MSTTTSTSTTKPLQFTDIDCSQITITEFKPNKTRESNQNSYINWSDSSQQRNVQLPAVVAVAGVKRWEGKVDKATGRQEKATISLLYPLRIKTHAGDKQVFDKADAMWTRVVDQLVEKEGLSKQEAEFKLNKLIAYPLDAKQKPMLDKEPSLKIKLPFDDLKNQWYEKVTRLHGREIKTPAVVFQQRIRTDSSKVILRDRPDITPQNIMDEIPKMSTVYCLVAMNQLTLINGRYTWPIKATKIVFELPKHDDLEMDLGDDVVHESAVSATGVSDAVPAASSSSSSSSHDQASVKPSLLQQLAALNQAAAAATDGHGTAVDPVVDHQVATGSHESQYEDYVSSGYDPE